MIVKLLSEDQIELIKKNITTIEKDMKQILTCDNVIVTQMSPMEQIQQRFWRPVYDRLAGLYDAVDWLTGNTTHRFRLRALPYLPPADSRLLEIGFGSGRLHLELAPEYQLAGLDRAFGMARLTQRRLSARKFYPGYVLVRMHLTDESWHLVKDTPKVIRMNQVLPG